MNKFIARAISSGLLYESDRDSANVFGFDNIVNSLRRVPFRSISELNICPATSCNLRCEYCDLYKGKSRLALRLIEECLADGKVFGANILNIIGGEPTLYSRLTEDIITVARGLKYQRVTVSTNGILLSPQIAKGWASAGLSTLQISIDAVYGKGKSFVKCEHALDIACRLFEEVIISHVYYGQTSTRDLKELILRLSRYPVRLDLKVEVPFDSRTLSAGLQDVADYIIAANRIAERYAFVLPPEVGSPNEIFCGAGLCHAFIDATGKVKPCGFVGDVIGNINVERFADIWLKKDWRRIWRPKQIRTKKCRYCENVRLCIGGCLARYRSSLMQCPQTGVPSKQKHSGACISSKPGR
ncbi:MAG: radical SAM protein [Verrucomicrobia bacterium]|nr:radical SAM protein [Verrucomicrobiota bacterium]